MKFFEINSAYQNKISGNQRKIKLLERKHDYLKMNSKENNFLIEQFEDLILYNHGLKDIQLLEIIIESGGSHTCHKTLPVCHLDREAAQISKPGVKTPVRRFATHSTFPSTMATKEAHSTALHTANPHCMGQSTSHASSCSPLCWYRHFSLSLSGYLHLSRD